MLIFDLRHELRDRQAGAVAGLRLLQTWAIEVRHRRDLERVVDQVGGMKVGQAS